MDCPICHDTIKIATICSCVHLGVKPSPMEIFGTLAFVLSVMVLIYEKFQSV